MAAFKYIQKLVDNKHKCAYKRELLVEDVMMKYFTNYGYFDSSDSTTNYCTSDSIWEVVPTSAKSEDDMKAKKEKPKISPLAQAILDNFKSIITSKHTMFVVSRDHELLQDKKWFGRNMTTAINAIIIDYNDGVETLITSDNNCGLVVAADTFEYIRTDMERAVMIKRLLSLLRRDEHSVLIIYTLSKDSVRKLVNKQALVPSGDGYLSKTSRSGFIRGYTHDELAHLAKMAGAKNVKNIIDFDNLPGTCIVMGL